MCFDWTSVQYHRPVGHLRARSRSQEHSDMLGADGSCNSSLPLNSILEQLGHKSRSLQTRLYTGVTHSNVRSPSDRQTELDHNGE